MTGAVHARMSRSGRISSQHAAPTDGQNFIMYSDEFGRIAQQPKPVAGIELIKQIFDAWKDSRDTNGVFCDLSEAFDCVHHNIIMASRVDPSDFYSFI
ncbi:hypothetical protein EVAR_34664_1 [Eumeta japonica]|uniref:Reverse transcriptase domain-containing protein n=1 Tax=Eumeta variegata TaxID=151549 RepID=A0A4C1VH64_EUMVA|nr:hypothetical protein EVAR_34664_1 [Eumeta japonica]